MVEVVERILNSVTNVAILGLILAIGKKIGYWEEIIKTLQIEVNSLRIKFHKVNNQVQRLIGADGGNRGN